MDIIIRLLQYQSGGNNCTTFDQLTFRLGVSEVLNMTETAVSTLSSALRGSFVTITS